MVGGVVQLTHLPGLVQGVLVGEETTLIPLVEPVIRLVQLHLKVIMEAMA
jgi:hypothetical protein